MEDAIRTWLNNRGINDSIISYAQLSWNDGNINIPIFAKDGKFLFNKTRRSPFSEEGPKYRYDAGATAQLYNVTALEGKEDIIICEGELDCLALLSKGFNAVSTTGGSGTFLPEWVDLFLEHKVFICYDWDEAGIRGAFKVLSVIPWARIVWLPKGKDVTEYFMLGHNEQEFIRLLNNAEGYILPGPMPEGTKKGMKEFVAKEAAWLDSLLKKEDELKRANWPYDHIRYLREAYIKKFESDRHRANYAGTYGKNMGRLQSAKNVPITRYIQFRPDRMANCIWHNEKTPSMHYYQSQNIVKCFGCDKRGDTIDVVMELKKVDLSAAIDIILGNEEKD